MRSLSPVEEATHERAAGPGHGLPRPARLGVLRDAEPLGRRQRPGPGEAGLPGAGDDERGDGLDARARGHRGHARGGAHPPAGDRRRRDGCRSTPTSRTATPSTRSCVAANVRLATQTGIAGLSIEDSSGDPTDPLLDLDLSVARIRAARRAIDDSGTGVLLTGRAEGFVVGRPDLDETIRRLQAYAEAGADCLYAPRIGTVEQVEAIVAAVAPKPVNLLVNAPFITVAEAADLGVRRISVGGTLARTAWGGFLRAAQRVRRPAGTFTAFQDLPDVDGGHPGDPLFAGRTTAGAQRRRLRRPAPDGRACPGSAPPDRAPGSGALRFPLMDIGDFSLDAFSLAGRRALVTGGNTGLGQAFTVALARAGADVFVVGLLDDGGETRRLVEDERPDVRRDPRRHHAARRSGPRSSRSASRRSARLDVLVNSAGICLLADVEDFDRAQWDPMVAVNLTAAFEMAHEASR